MRGGPAGIIGGLPTAAASPTQAPPEISCDADAWPGRIPKPTLDGRVPGWLGGSGKQPGQFGWIHEIACPGENELDVSGLLDRRVQKLTLHPAAR